MIIKIELKNVSVEQAQQVLDLVLTRLELEGMEGNVVATSVEDNESEII